MRVGSMKSIAVAQTKKPWQCLSALFFFSHLCHIRQVDFLVFAVCGFSLVQQGSLLICLRQISCKTSQVDERRVGAQKPEAKATTRNRTASKRMKRK